MFLAESNVYAIELIALGHKARSALLASRGIARPLRAFPKAPYFEAGGEIIWIGQHLPARHPRAAITAHPVATGQIVTLGVLPEFTWRCELPPMSAIDPGIVRETAGALLDTARALGPARGFGALLCHTELDFPLTLALDRVCRLARAYALGDATSVHNASKALLGLGAGLTPSGDDLVAAALFGHRLINQDEAWARVGSELVRDADTATHAISAALLGDTVAGESFEPLHALADALVAGDAGAALAAARALVCIGHASGWDMFTGFLLGILPQRIIVDG